MTDHAQPLPSKMQWLIMTILSLESFNCLPIYYFVVIPTPCFQTVAIPGFNVSNNVNLQESYDFRVRESN
jgi:hypothetical protein